MFRAINTDSLEVETALYNYSTPIKYSNESEPSSYYTLLSPECCICVTGKNTKKDPLFSENRHPISWSALYNKYSLSQDFYYSKDINDMLAKTVSRSTILWEDLACFVDHSEYFKREYE